MPAEPLSSTEAARLARRYEAERMGALGWTFEEYVAYCQLADDEERAEFRGKVIRRLQRSEVVASARRRALRLIPGGRDG